MAKKRQKQYNPHSKFNPVVQAKRIEDNKTQLKRLSQTIELITESNERHYKLLGNFARHDMKNIIINMNSILDLYKENIPEDVIEAIQLNIDAMSITMSNFSKLVPHADTVKFKFSELLIAIRILTTPIIDSSLIDGVLEFDINDDTEIDLPFQAILQMVNNIVVNAVKAVENNPGPKKIRLVAAVLNQNLIIEVHDNGCAIAPENIEKIYDYSFSTTGGSGIGLNHAKFLCEKFNGNISLSLIEKNEMNKAFKINIPV